ncbi:MAG: TIGR02452 family protein [Planctomycetales bacterium]|nr:TIGR02452 family protein [Planctomycetales bacterium]
MNLKDAAQEVLQLIGSGRYWCASGEVDFADSQRRAVDGTRLFTPESLNSLRSQASSGRLVGPPSQATIVRPGGPAPVEVVDGTTQVMAQALVKRSGAAAHVALLNFASARSPGGGFLNGAKAQEEDLCRCSGLYPCLLRCMEYYEANRRQDSLLYTDHLIFSPGVPFFKTRGTGNLLETPFLVSVITAPAPNSGPFLRRHPGRVDQVATTFLRRWENVLCAAHAVGVTHLLLGAWGCGAFGGDPAVASRTARQAIERYGAGFSRIVFAIPGGGRRSQANLDAFRSTFD